LISSILPLFNIEAAGVAPVTGVADTLIVVTGVAPDAPVLFKPELIFAISVEVGRVLLNAAIYPFGSALAQALS